MNIFYLDESPIDCATYHVDKHVVKMILEYAQLLSTAHRVLDKSTNSLFYKETHTNHPCAIWVRQSNLHYTWLYNLLVNLCKEYTFRYRKVHKVASSFLLLELRSLPENIPYSGFVEPPKAMPDECKVPSTIKSYHNYYNLHKRKLFVWTKRETPYFVHL